MPPPFEGEEPAEPWYRVPMPSFGGYTADDLDRCGDLPPHTELIDGSLVFSVYSWDVQSLVGSALDCHRDEAPSAEGRGTGSPGLMIKLGYPDPESDILGVQVQAADDEWCSWFAPAQVALVVEVAAVDGPPRISARSRARAHREAGVPLLWSFEKEGGATVVRVHDLASGAPSTRQAVYRGRLRAERPFEVDMELSGVRPG